MALNCNTDLSWFDHIVPCGIEGKGVTSLSKETGKIHTVDTIIPLFLKYFTEVFECKCESLEIDVQEEILSSMYSKLMAQIQAG